MKINLLFLLIILSYFPLIFEAKAHPIEFSKQHYSQEYLSISPETFLKFSPYDLNLPINKQYIPFEHPLYKRLNSWVKKIDQLMRKKYPGYFNHVPRPLIIISPYVMSSDSAYVSSLNRCFSIPIHFNSKKSREGGPSNDDSYLEISSGELLAKNELEKCVMDRHFKNKPKLILPYLNFIFNKCQVVFEENKNRFEVQGSCPLSLSLPHNDYKGFSLSATSNIISVSAETLLIIDSEFKAISLLAHELVHYYQGHLNYSTLIKTSSPFIYSTKEISFNENPSPSKDEELLHLASLLKEKDDKTESVQIKNLIEGSKEKGLAEYTDEYEADVMAAFILNEVGIDPHFMLLAGLDGIELMMQKKALPLTDTPHCRDLYEENWPQIPFIGLLDDPHHNPCYRAWILHEDIKIHGYIGPFNAISNDEEWNKERQSLSVYFENAENSNP